MEFNEDISVELVDERDSSWEDYSPTFRVYLQDPSTDFVAATTATYDLRNVDVVGAIDWAQRATEGTEQSFALALVAEKDGRSSDPGRGLVWLLGRDSNAAP